MHCNGKRTVRNHKKIKQFKTILWGQKVVVLMDHRNLTYDTTDHVIDWVLQQRLLLEEYGVEI